MAGSIALVAALAIVCFKIPGLFWILLIMIGLLSKKGWRGSGNAYGTARMAEYVDLLLAGLLHQSGGLILGRVPHDVRPPCGFALKMLWRLPFRLSDLANRIVLQAFLPNKPNHRPGLIRLQQFVHLVTFAATGRGKGVGVLIPNLLRYPHSCVVTDPKSELFRITASHRQKSLEHRIIRLDPFELAGPGGDTFNPLDLIDPHSPFLIEQCRDIANMLVIRTGNEHEPHFNDAAEMVLTAFIAFVAASETNPLHRNLQTVREIVSSRARFTKAVEIMQQSQACGGMLQRYGHQLGWLVDRELGSVLSTVQRHTHFLDSQTVAKNTTTSSFDPRHLRHEKMSIYLCLPHDKLQTLAPLQRLWIGTILRAVAASGADETNPVLFFLDEAGHIGQNLNALEEAVTLLRGMGVRLWFFFQSVGQLEGCFGEKAKVFLDNIDTQQFFGINSIDSAEMVSKRMGESTITTQSYQEGQSYSYSRSTGAEPSSRQYSYNSSNNYSEIARSLMKPEEIIRLPEDTVLIFHRNLPPILGSLVKYYSDPEFQPVRRFWALPQSIDTLAHAACVAILGISSLAAALIYEPETPRQYSYQAIENPVVKPEFFSDSGSANTKA
ncbi:MAG: type IV secretory system conjugative DNA transfer family protein, partial [Planctomycetota bacterium]